MLLGIQSRMARAALGLGVRELAASAGVAPYTITRLEQGTDVSRRTQAAVRAALEGAGLEIIDPDRTGGPGVRLRSYVGPSTDGAGPGPQP